MANPNYALESTFAIEQVLEPSTFQNIANSSHILLAMLVERGRYNVGFQVVSSLKGTKALVPVFTRVGNAEGVTKSGQYTPMNLTETGDDDFDHAEFPFSTYRANFPMDERERAFVMANPRANLDLFRAKTMQALGGFANVMNNDVIGSSDVAEDALLGLFFVLPDTPASSTNNVGNIGGYDATPAWRPQERSLSGSTFAVNHLSEMINEGRQDFLRGLGGTRQPDLILAAESSTNRLFSQVQDVFRNLQRFIRNERMVELGFDNIVAWGATIHPLLNPPTGEEDTMVALSTDSWYFGGDLAPIPLEPTRKTGTTVMEHMLIWRAMLACGNPPLNVKYRDFD